MPFISNNRTSVLIDQQVPGFVREEHEIFLEFVRSYYRFLETPSYIKPVTSNLTISTVIGATTPYGVDYTNTVVVSLPVGRSNVAIANGTKIRIANTDVGAYAANVVPGSNTFNITGNSYPVRLVGERFFVYKTVANAPGADLTNIMKNFGRYMDVDNARDNDQILQTLYNNYIKLLPKNMLADKNLVLKHAKDFYRSRGSEKSIRFLMRALYNTTAEVYYPKQDVLRASDGKWYVERALRVQNGAINNVANSMVYSYFQNKEVKGLTSKATALVEAVNVFYDNNTLVTELRISNSNKPFLSDESIYALFEEDGQVKYATARIFGGQIVDIDIVNGGTGYVEGTTVPIIPVNGSGTGGLVRISRVSAGGIERIFIEGSLPDNGGAGYRGRIEDGPEARGGDFITVSGGGGIGALGEVESVWENIYHPNQYNICNTRISDVANVRCDMYGFATEVANGGLTVDGASTVGETVIADAVGYWSYSNTGAAKFCFVVEPGESYFGTPTFTIQANTIVQEMGIIGKLKILNPGLNYQVNDVIEFHNRNEANSFGSGAAARVSVVNAAGAIMNVAWVQISGHYIGGEGYDYTMMPYCVIKSATGTGANVQPMTTLGRGGSFTFTTEDIGIIRRFTIVNPGTGYTVPPILDLTTGHTGNVAVVNTSVVTGIYSYPGRYINDDGFISAQNYLQNRDYYQNFSYVVRTDKPLSKYRNTLKSLTHPAGMKMFGQYEKEDIEATNINGAQVFSSSHYPDLVKTGLIFHMSAANTGTTTAGRIANLINTSYEGEMLNGVSVTNGLIRFDGLNDVIRFPNSTTLDLQNLTLETWINVPSTFQNAVIFQKGANGSQYSLEFNLLGDLVFNAKINGVWQQAASLTATRVPPPGYAAVRPGFNAEDYIRSNRWTHIALTYTSGAQRLYVNNTLVASSALAGTIATNNSGVSVGASGAYNDIYRWSYLIGRISIMRVYNRVLSAAEVKRNFNTDRERFGV